MTERWRPLDLRTRGTYGPFNGELVVLRLQRRTYNRDIRYLVGKFDTEGQKAWFLTGPGIEDPVRLRRFYTISWCRLPTE